MKEYDMQYDMASSGYDERTNTWWIKSGCANDMRAPRLERGCLAAPDPKSRRTPELSPKAEGLPPFLPPVAFHARLNALSANKMQSTTRSTTCRIGYADPPYPGCAHRYPENTEVDHRELIAAPFERREALVA